MRLQTTGGCCGPRLVKALTDQEGNVVQEFEPS